MTNNTTVPNIKQILDRCQKDLEHATGKPVSVHYSIKIHKITVDTIIQIVCEHFQLTWTQIIKQTRERERIIPRQLFVWLACTYTNTSLVELARITGGQDHTTVIHARERVREMIATKDSLYIEPLNAIEKKLFSINEAQTNP